MIFCPVWTNGVSRQSLALVAFRGSPAVWQVLGHPAEALIQ